MFIFYFGKQHMSVSYHIEDNDKELFSEAKIVEYASKLNNNNGIICFKNFTC